MVTPLRAAPPPAPAPAPPALRSTDRAPATGDGRPASAALATPGDHGVPKPDKVEATARPGRPGSLVDIRV